MRSIITIITLLNLTFLSLQVESATNAQKISPSFTLQYFEDSSNKLSISDINNSDSIASIKWINRPVDQTLNFGMSNSAFWIKCQFHIEKNDTSHYYIIIRSSIIDYLDIYAGTQKSIKMYQLGDRRSFSERPVHYPQFVIPLQRDSIHYYSPVYIRMATYDGVHEAVPIQILSETELKHLQTFDIFQNGLFYGLLIFMILLSIALIFIIKDKSQILFVAYVLCFGLWSLVLRGFGDMFLWPFMPISNTILMLSVYGFGTFMTWFSVEFLSLHKINAVLDKTIKTILILMTAISIPLILSDHYKLFFSEYMIVIIVEMILLQISTVICLLRKSSESYFYAWSWLIIFIGSFLYIGKVFGFFPSIFLTENTFQIGIIFQATVLSIGIIVRVYTMMKKANQNLEAVIEVRTAELRQANEMLQELSMKDPLTGIYNRRYFQEQFTITSKIQDRNNQFLSILIIDVDFFKQFNDVYGHIEGDHCLQKIADVIYKSLPRKSDFCARYGGEEFIICLPGTDAKGAYLVAERIRTNVLSERIPHAKSSIAGVVTISIGICDTSDKLDKNLDQLIQKADKSLYKAKHNGRNQACLYSLPIDK